MRLGWLVLFAAILLGCSARPDVVKNVGGYSGLGFNRVYVVSHGWHTGFVVPSDAMYALLPALSERFGDSPYIEFGWGDKGFYQAKEITVGLTIQAIFWPTESVVHAVAVPEDVAGYFSHSEVRLLCLREDELASLLKFISSSFYVDENGAVVALRNGIYGDSQFYKGVGEYYLMNTCNTWTAKGLKSAGMDIPYTFKLTADSIMAYLDEMGQTQEKAAESTVPQCSIEEGYPAIIPLRPATQ